MDFRAALRSGASDEELGALIDRTWRARTDRYSAIRTAATADGGDDTGNDGDDPSGGRRVEMSFIGG